MLCLHKTSGKLGETAGWWDMPYTCTLGTLCCAPGPALCLPQLPVHKRNIGSHWWYSALLSAPLLPLAASRGHAGRAPAFPLPASRGSGKDGSLLLAGSSPCVPCYILRVQGWGARQVNRLLPWQDYVGIHGVYAHSCNTLCDGGVRGELQIGSNRIGTWVQAAVQHWLPLAPGSSPAISSK